MPEGVSRRSFLGGGLATAATLGAGRVSQTLPMFLTDRGSGKKGRHGQHGTRVMFADGFESGAFTNWNSCQWNSGTARNDTCQTYDGTSEYSVTVADGGSGHSKAARFELHEGDIVISTERCEIGEPTIGGASQVVPGDELWMSWDMKFDSSFPTPGGDWCVIWQWHGNVGGSSPPLCLDIAGDDIIYLANNQPAQYTRTAVQSVQRNVWQHWMIHAKFHESSATGFAEVYIDDRVVVPKHARMTLLTGDTGAYFKCGIYRDATPVEPTAILWHDNIVFTAP